jgi:hypothetical protein
VSKGNNRKGVRKLLNFKICQLLKDFDDFNLFGNLFFNSSQNTTDSSPCVPLANRVALHLQQHRYFQLSNTQLFN